MIILAFSKQNEIEQKMCSMLMLQHFPNLQMMSIPDEKMLHSSLVTHHPSLIILHYNFTADTLSLLNQINALPKPKKTRIMFGLILPFSVKITPADARRQNIQFIIQDGPTLGTNLLKALRKTFAKGVSPHPRGKIKNV